MCIIIRRLPRMISISLVLRHVLIPPLLLLLDCTVGHTACPPLTQCTKQRCEMQGRWLEGLNAKPGQWLVEVHLKRSRVRFGHSPKELLFLQLSASSQPLRGAPVGRAQTVQVTEWAAALPKGRERRKLFIQSVSKRSFTFKKFKCLSAGKFHQNRRIQTDFCRPQFVLCCRQCTAIFLQTIATSTNERLKKESCAGVCACFLLCIHHKLMKESSQPGHSAQCTPFSCAYNHCKDGAAAQWVYSCFPPFHPK